MNRVVISGVTGFVGGHLSEKLNPDFKVLGLSRKKQYLDLINYNDLDVKMLDDSYAFVHLAGKAHDLKKTSKETEYFEVNRDLTKKIFDQFIKSKCEVFVYMSSVKAVADSLNGVLDELHIPNPETPYGKSKLAAEQYILSQNIPENKRVYILRPCMIHGPGNKGNLNLLYNMISKGLPYPLGCYQNTRSFISVDNVCFIIGELLRKRTIPSGVYNVSDSEYMSTLDIVNKIGDVLDKKNHILNIPKSIINFVAVVCDILDLPLTTERVSKLTENYRVSNNKILEAIDKPLPLSTEEGILITLNSFKSKTN